MTNDINKLKLFRIWALALFAHNPKDVYLKAACDYDKKIQELAEHKN